MKTITLSLVILLQGCSAVGAALDSALKTNDNKPSLADVGAKIDGDMIVYGIEKSLFVPKHPKRCKELHKSDQAACEQKVKQLNQHLKKYTDGAE